MEYAVEKIGRPFKIELNMPGSKSITIRDLALSALANGTSVIRSAGVCDDTFRMVDSLRRMGIRIDAEEDDILRIYGSNGRLSDSAVELHVGQSATSTRLLMALCALRSGTTTIDGHPSMQARPNKYLLDALKNVGADVTSTNDGYLPTSIKGMGRGADAITMSGDKSSQYFSALMLIAPLLPNGLRIDVDGELVSKPYIDITIREMLKFGVSVENNGYHSFIVHPQTYSPVDLVVEGDASAASYFSALATIHGGEVTFRNLGTDTSQGDYGFFDICEILGATVMKNATTTTVIGPRNGLLNRLVDPLNMEFMPDVAVTLIATAPFIPGNTRITGLSTLRIKECDRLAASANELRKCGIHVTEGPDWIDVPFWENPNVTEEIRISTYDDHRMAMSLAVLGSKTNGIVVTDSQCVEKTYPRFWDDFRKLYS